MHKGQTTIKDIASQLGISPSTVSKALKNHPDISLETRKKVNDLAKELHYNPNPIALSLRSSKTKTIGLIVPEIVHHFFSSVISGIEDVAYDAGYSVMIYQSNESYNREVIAVKSLLNNRVDGILISVSKETRNYDHLKEIKEHSVPFVMFDRVCDEIIADKVIVDDYQGAYNATRHMIVTGCRRIAHFAGPPGLKIADLRRSGYTDALIDHNLKIERDLVIFCDNFNQAIIRTKQLMSNPQPPDAIIAVNELTATGVIKAAAEIGTRVPQDLSVIGFTNGLISQVVHPTLTTVDQHGYQIGQTSVQMLLDRMIRNETDYPAVEQVIKTDLVVRESTRG